MMPAYKQGVMNAFLFSAAREGHEDIVRLVLSGHAVKAQVNCLDTYMRSPLYITVHKGHFPVAEQLIELGANIELVDSRGVSVLSLAAFLGKTKICRLLIRQGAQYTSRDRAGLTPLHYAAYQGAVVVECVCQWEGGGGWLPCVVQYV